MPKKLPPIPAAHKLKLRKTLSAPGLLTIVRKEFEQIPEHRGGKPYYPLPDVLMSALAVFGLKLPRSYNLMTIVMKKRSKQI
jgi:hypothetical protein